MIDLNMCKSYRPNLPERQRRVCWLMETKMGIDPTGVAAEGMDEDGYFLKGPDFVRTWQSWTEAQKAVWVEFEDVFESWLLTQ